MRTLLRIFGVLLGAVVVAVVARYGWLSAESIFDRTLAAIWNAGIALAGLFGHAVALRVWRVNRAWALVIGVFALVALAINLSNSLGFLSSKDSNRAAQIERLEQTRTASQAQLQRLIGEREAMAFEHAATIAVEAAQRAVEAAETAKQAECSTGRGPRCRKREDALDAANAELVRLSGELAKTEAAAELDGRIAELRESLDGGEVTGEANAQGAALARLFGLEGAAVDVAVMQRFAMAAAIEVLIVLALVAAELLSTAQRRPDATEEPGKAMSEPPPVNADVAIDEARAERPGASFVPRARDEAMVADVLADLLSPGSRARVEIEALYRAYRAACRARGLPALEPAEGAEAIVRECRVAGLEVAAAGDLVYVRGVKLAA